MKQLKNLKSYKSALVEILCKLGGYSLAKWLTRHQVKIVMMHRFSEQEAPGYLDRKTLRKQISILKSEFNVIALRDFIRLSATNKRPPKNSIILTIDDGYQDAYDIAYPEFKAENMPVTLFATSGFIDRKCWLWPDRVSTLLNSHPEALQVDFDGKNIQLPAKSYQSWQRIIDYLIPLSLAEKNTWIDECANKNNISLATEIPKKYAPCTWEQLKEMSDSVVDIGGHTVSHPILSAETLESVEQQLSQSKNRLEEQLKKEVVSFCYPNGQPNDFTSEIEKLVDKCGYQIAVAANCYSIDMSNRFALPRFVMSENMYHFKKVIYGVQWIARKLFPKSEL